MPSDFDTTIAEQSSRPFINANNPTQREEGLLEFRLIYQGTLHPNGAPSEKHRIRCYLHPQLRRLWQLHKGIRQLAAQLGNQSNPVSGATEQERVDAGLIAMGQNWCNAGFNLVPLVRSKPSLRCVLDIVLLRPQEDRFIFKAGDIDGQLKTLFDALRIPKTKEETGNAIPTADETPLFCLLEDDRLISEVRVNSDQLLLLPGYKVVTANDAFVVITVTLTHTSGSPFDRWFD